MVKWPVVALAFAGRYFLATLAVRLHPQIPLVALPGLALLWIARLLLILRQTRHANNYGVDDRAGADLHALILQIFPNLIEQQLARVVTFH